MASQLKVDTITGVTTAGSIAVTGEGNSTTTNLQQGLAKAWLKWNGTGIIALGDSFNCTSLTDNGVGRGQIDWVSAMSSKQVATGCSASNDEASDNRDRTAAFTPISASRAYFTTYECASGSADDCEANGGIVNGDLA